MTAIKSIVDVLVPAWLHAGAFPSPGHQCMLVASLHHSRSPPHSVNSALVEVPKVITLVGVDFRYCSGGDLFGDDRASDNSTSPEAPESVDARSSEPDLKRVRIGQTRRELPISSERPLSFRSGRCGNPSDNPGAVRASLCERRLVRSSSGLPSPVAYPPARHTCAPRNRSHYAARTAARRPGAEP